MDIHPRGRIWKATYATLVLGGFALGPSNAKVAGHSVNEAAGDAGARVRTRAVSSQQSRSVDPRGVAHNAADRPNVLLILVDDLKPALGSYGDPVAKTPNIDKLAKRGMRFDLAYANQAVCAPSRFTLMLGAHSTSTGLYGLGSQLRDLVPNAITMPQHFARHGYRTESLGKVFHIGHGNHGDPQSFSVPHFHDQVVEYLEPASTHGGKLTREEALFTNQRLDDIPSLPRGAAFESPVANDNDYADGRVAEETIKRMRAASERRKGDGTPFFITVGFVRPHLPFSAPKKYWDLYDPATLPMPEFERPPAAAPAVAAKRGGEIAAYEPVPEEGPIDDALTRQLIHGYYASTSFADAQIGKVMAELDRLDLADNTLVVLWGDHGFHLGDHGIWTKHTNYEQANRIPLLMVAPGVTKPGSSTKQLAESVDIFPTLAELAHVPAPTGPQPIDGISLMPVLKNPEARVRDHAYHAYPKEKLGRAIRTERYRLVEWKGFGESPDAAEYELYDYETDPLETENLAAQKPEVLAALEKKLAAHPAPASRAPTRKSAQLAGAAAQSLTRYVKYEVSGQTAWGLLEGDTIRELRGNVFDNAKPSGRTVRLADVTLLPPAEAKKVIAAGLNYRSHIGEQPAATHVGLFAKLPTSLIGHDADIVYPADATNVHYEAEVCVVMGRKAKNITEAQVKDHVFGVAPCNDVSERDWQEADLQWLRAKGADTFGPIGPALVRGADYNKLKLIGRHNGKVVQETTTDLLIFSIDKVVSYISRYVTLEPGDVIFTGTPGTTRAMRPGDTFEVEIEGLGTLRNSVVAEQRAPGPR